MAKTDEVVRLMQHAANLLDACDPYGNARIAAEYGPSEDEPAVLARALAEQAAIANAAATLRMVAAAIGEAESDTVGGGQ